MGTGTHSCWQLDSEHHGLVIADRGHLAGGAELGLPGTAHHPCQGPGGSEGPLLQAHTPQGPPQPRGTWKGEGKARWIKAKPGAAIRSLNFHTKLIHSLQMEIQSRIERGRQKVCLGGEKKYFSKNQELWIAALDFYPRRIRHNNTSLIDLSYFLNARLLSVGLEKSCLLFATF